MYFTNKISKAGMLVLASVIVIISCQKIVHPALGNYPRDTNPPGGPLKFYAALDGTNVDSIRANFGTDNNVSYVPGVSGQAVTFDPVKKGFINWPSANDFAAQTNFSVSLWFNAGDTSKKDHNNADGILAFAKTSDFWGNITIFADHETSTSDSMRLTIVLAGNFITHDNANRIPHMYDGQWHHLVVTYDATSSLYTLYIDGSQYEQKSITGVAFKDASVLVVGGFQQAAGVQGDYSSNTWMSPFPGAIDQVRLYGTVLSAADVSGLFTSKL
jgi:Concanavalin A-like lectin/glucanases superfamily